MQAMAEAAVASGFLHLGFSPHSPIPFESPCNMLAEHVPLYRRELEQIRREFGDRCRFYAGMEIDYLSGCCGANTRPVKDYGLDFTISSVHFIRNRRGETVDVDGHFDSFAKKMGVYFDNDIDYVVRAFYDASLEMLSLGGFDILGHFDKISQNASYYKPGIEQEGWYQDIVQNYINEIIASGVIVEINTKAREEHGRFFPNDIYWRRLMDAGVPLMVNSDAHYADRLDASRAEAFEILESLK